jgi:hypothetical protein
MAGGACKSEVETTVDGEHRPGFTEAEFFGILKIVGFTLFYASWNSYRRRNEEWESRCVYK